MEVETAIFTGQFFHNLLAGAATLEKLGSVATLAGGLHEHLAGAERTQRVGVAKSITRVSTSLSFLAAIVCAASAFKGLALGLQLLFFLFKQQKTVFRVTRKSTLVATWQDCLAESWTVYFHGTYSVGNDLFATFTRLVNDFLAGLAIAEVAGVEAVVATGQRFPTLFVTQRRSCSADDWSRDYLIPACTPKGLVDSDGAVTALARVALPRTRVDSTG